jgi:hypothetical protein
LPLLVLGMLAGSRKLQYRRALSFTQLSHQHDLAVREFEGVVMDMQQIHVHLPELRDLFLETPDREARSETIERIVALDLLIEGDLGPGEEANCDVGLADLCETSRDRVAEVGRYKLVTDLCRPGGDVV